MVNSKQLFLEFKNKLTLKEAADEVEAIAYRVFDSIFGLSRTDVLVGKQIIEHSEFSEQLADIISRINQNEPIQYILEEAWFFGLKFYVNSSVLIPRPETEELVRLISDEYADTNFTLLDIGTGSGCIPISIKFKCPTAKIFATDISDEAIAVAKRNADTLKSAVQFLHHDILIEEIPFDLLDVIVSNPPYVLENESDGLRENVIKYEPHLALFTPDNDPLRFYKAIAEKGIHALKPNGKIVVEINQQFGKEVANLFLETGFVNIEIKKDIFGKDRIVTGKKP